MSIKILTAKDFYSIKEQDVFKPEYIGLILDKIKTASPEKYEKYGLDTLTDYAKSMLLKDYFKDCLVQIKEDVFVKWVDFTQIVRFDNNKITHRFIGGVYDIKLCDKSGNYLDSKLYGMLLSNFSE